MEVFHVSQLHSQNLICSGLFTCNMSNVLKSSRGGGWEDFKGSETTDSKV